MDPTSNITKPPILSCIHKLIDFSEEMSMIIQYMMDSSKKTNVFSVPSVQCDPYRTITLVCSRDFFLFFIFVPFSYLICFY